MAATSNDFASLAGRLEALESENKARKQGKISTGQWNSIMKPSQKCVSKEFNAFI